MRSSVATLFPKCIKSFFALALTVGLVPAAAFAAEGEGGAGASQEDSWAAGAAAENENQSTPDESQDESAAAGSVWQENDGEDEGSSGDVPDKSGTYSSTSEDDAAGSDDANLAIPAGEIINQEMPLEVVAQSESTRSFFLAQTLESTRTVPVVSAKLPIDTGASSGDVAEGDASDGATGAEGAEGGAGEEGGEDSDESDLGGSSEEGTSAPSIDPDSVVIGSFEQDGIVYAFEPGGETVAAVAVDYAKLPEETVRYQFLVMPEAVSPDGNEYYSVTRIAANAFSGLKAQNANQEYTGCVELFSDEELLAEAGIDPADVAGFISANGDVPDKSGTYEDQDQSTTDESQDEPVGASFSLRQDDGENDEQAGAKADENADFTNPLAGCPGILVLGIPASVTSIEDDAFAGFDTLQYVIVSEDNPNFASYDGALYSADLATLRLIPEGRVGAVCVAVNVTSVEPEVFSHCPYVTTLVADADSAAFLNSTDAAECGIEVAVEEGEDVTGAVKLSEIVMSLCKELRHRDTSPVSDALISTATDYKVRSNSGNSLTVTNGMQSWSVTTSGTKGDTIARRWAPLLGPDYTHFYADDDMTYTSGTIVSETCPNSDEWKNGVLDVSRVGRYRIGFISGSTSYYAVGTAMTNFDDSLRTYYGPYPVYSRGIGDLRALCWSPQSGFLGTRSTVGNNTAWTTAMIDKTSARGVLTARCEAAAWGYGRGSLLISPPYTVALTYYGSFYDSDNLVDGHPAPVVGSWDSQSAPLLNGQSSSEKWGSAEIWDTGIDEPAENPVNVGMPGSSSYYMPIPENFTSGYTFVGWNIDPEATAKTTTGWFYHVNSDKITNRVVTESTALYAIYQRGYPVNWDIERFGGEGAHFTKFGENSTTVSGSNTHSVATGTGNNKNDYEVAIIENPSDTANLPGTTRFPKVGNKADGVRFLGWTDDPSGAAPSWRTDGNAGKYFDWDSGVIRLTEDEFKVDHGDGTVETYPIDKFRNSTFYAVWETDVTFNAASYGGLIANGSDAVDKGAEVLTRTVFNNQPIPSVDDLASAYADATKSLDKSWLKDPQAGFVPVSVTEPAGVVDGSIVPNKYSFANGYDPGTWRFKGWTTIENPNATGTNTAHSDGIELKSGEVAGDDLSQALIPDGAATYYGVWECDIDWAAETWVDEAGQNPVTPTVNPTTADNSGWLLYGYELTAPGMGGIPNSHTFREWTDPLGVKLTSPMGKYTVVNGGTLTGSLAPNVYRVVLKDALGGNIDTAGLDGLYVKYGTGWFADPECKTPLASGTAYSLPASLAAGITRDGYELVGYAMHKNALAPEFFAARGDDGEWAFSATELPMGYSLFSDDVFTGDVEAGDSFDLYKEAYVWPVWKTSVQVDADGGTLADGSEVAATQVLYASAGQPIPQATIPADVTKTGYRFLGWQAHFGAYSEADGTQHPEADGELYTGRAGEKVDVPAALTLTAKWEAVKYPVVLQLNTGGIDISNSALTVDYGSWSGTGQQAVWGNPVHGATEMVGWYTVEDGNVTLPTPSYSGYEVESWTVATDLTNVHYDAAAAGNKYVAQAGGEFAKNGALANSGTKTFTLTTGTGAGDVRGAFVLRANWSTAKGYKLTTQVYLDGNKVAAGAEINCYDAAATAMPSLYYVTGLGLSDLKAKPGYRFAGWKAQKLVGGSPASMLQRDGQTVDNLANTADPAAGAGLAIAPGTTGDNVVTLAAYFTTENYGLTINMGAVPDAEFSSAVSSANWAAAKDDTGAEVAGQWAYGPGFTVKNASVDGAAPASGKVTLPTPQRAGYSFAGWDRPELVSGSGTAADPYKLELSATYDLMAPLTLTAKWDKAGYRITYAHPHATLVEDALNRTNISTFDSDTIAGTNAVVVTPPSQLEEGFYASFDGWLLKDVNLNDGTWQYRADLGGSMLRANAGTASITIDKSNIEALFPAANKDEAGNFTLNLVATYTAIPYDALVKLEGGTFAGLDTGAWKASGADWTVDYDCDTADIPLPTPPYAYGKNFLGWTLVRYADADRTQPVGDPLFIAADAGAKIQKDDIRFLTFTAKWDGLEDKVHFEYNADQSGELGTGHAGVPTDQAVKFGEAMPSGLAVPQRTGYVFQGFFDTPDAEGGLQYYNASMAGARTWDKMPEYATEGDSQVVVPHTLWARWAPEAAPGTNPENQPVPGVIVPGPPADPDPARSTHGQFTAKKGDNGAVTSPAFSGFYNGRWVRDVSDVVTVNIDSYVLDAGCSFEEVKAAFYRAGEAMPHLQGFLIESTQDIISLADLGRGTAFSFRFKVGDLTSSVDDAASFVLDGNGIVALYGKNEVKLEEGDGGDPPSLEPENGDTVFATFDANGGGWKQADGSVAGSVYTQTEFQRGLYTGDEARGEYVKLPPQSGAAADPVREGYTFLGWSLVQDCSGAGGDAADHATGQRNELFKITTKLKKHYIAHWAVERIDVTLMSNKAADDTSSLGPVKVEFGSAPALGELLPGGFTAPVNDGYEFLGYFSEANGGVQYFGRDGKAVRAFDLGGAEKKASVFAHWKKTANTEPSQPDVLPPNPDDPFPGQPSVVIPTTPENQRFELVATDGRGVQGVEALRGTYDGYYTRSTAPGSTDVAVTLLSFAPEDEVYGTVAKMIERFQEAGHAPATGGKYLQGFRVLSTGAFVSVVPLLAGEPVTFTAKLADLVGGIDPASAVFAAGAVEAVYDATSPVKPDNWEGPWPDPDQPGGDTQVYNVFDARGGLFPAGSDYGAVRFAAVASTYNGTVNKPAVDPTYDDIDYTYRFAGWFDANGRPFEEVATSQSSAVPTTYYARYTHTNFTFQLFDAQQGVAGVHQTSGMPAGGASLGDLTVYKGQELVDEPANGYGTAIPAVKRQFAEAEAALPERTGYDFIGFFWKQNEGTADEKLVPFYLSSQKFAAQYATQQGWAVASAYDNSGVYDFADGTGWGNVTGLADDGDSLKLYALWNAHTYVITWNYNNDNRRDYVYEERDAAGNKVDLTVAPTTTVKYGDSIDAAVPGIKDPAYEFLGWYSGWNADAAGTVQVVRKPVEYSSAEATDFTAGDWAHSEKLTFAPDNPYYFVADGAGGFRFEPHNVEGLDAAGRAISLFACFDLNDPVPYNLRIYLAKDSASNHGYFGRISTGAIVKGTPGVAGFGGVDYFTETYDVEDLKKASVDLSKMLGVQILSDAGYRPAGWYNVLEPGTAVSPLIEKGTSGYRAFYLEWTANRYTIDLRDDTLRIAGQEDFTKPLGTVTWQPNVRSFTPNLGQSAEERAIVFPTLSVDYASGYRFKGWLRCDENGVLFEESASNPLIQPGQGVTFDADYVQKMFGGADEGTAHYGAVWVPLEYEIRFQVQRDEVAGPDLDDLHDAMTITSAPATSAEAVQPMVTLPYPHTSDNRQLFKYWSTRTTEGLSPEVCAGWQANTQLTLNELLSTVRARDIVEEDGKLVVRLYAIWGGAALSSDVPLSVNILLDPWTPDREDGSGKIITNSEGVYAAGDEWVGADADGRAPATVTANAWVGTPAENDATGVRVESLTFARGDAELFRNGRTGADDSAAFDLLIYAGKRGEQVEPLSINLGQDFAVFLRDGATGQSGHLSTVGDRTTLEGLGFDGTITSASPLLLYYDLVWRDGTDLGAYPLMANTAADGGMNDNWVPNESGPGMVRDFRTIAKLYYTIGLAS